MLAGGVALADVAVPPVARVTDQTGTLSAPQIGALEQKLAAFEAQKGSQIAVLIVPTTAPETIEQYSIRVAEAWKLGRKGVDDGILLVVAKDDHALRIEVGYGLEGAVPDAIAKRIVAEIVTPKFRDGDFAGGIDAGVDQLIRVIQGEALPPPPRRRSRDSAGDTFQMLLGLGFFALLVSQAMGRAIGEVPSALVAGGIFGVIAWLIVGMVALGAAAGVILFVVSLLSQFGRSHGGWGGPGGVFRSGGGSLGGGGFGGGGFGGGGGGFGGGGASGRW